jgi:hypothetical protein
MNAAEQGLYQRGPPMEHLSNTVSIAMSTEKVIQKKKLGRPATGNDPIRTFRLSDEKVAEIEAWAARQPDKPSRSEALRRLIDLGMKAPPARSLGKKR